MPSIHFNLPLSLKKALDEEAEQSAQSVESLILSILSDHLNLKLHTIFQVSTSGALVAGVYDKEVTISTLLQHGDFGLGTFAGLDGEMVILDGRAYQIHGSGNVSVAGPDAGAPFAVVTAFAADRTAAIEAISSFSDLEAKCDPFRISDNIFHAFRLDGHFKHLKTRAVCPPKPGATLIDAAKTQSEFVFENVSGTLVGIWSPVFSSQFSVAGYHFHFISDDRARGGHVLEVKADKLELQVENLTDFRLALPETEHFLKADLSKDIAAALNSAERSH